MKKRILTKRGLVVTNAFTVIPGLFQNVERLQEEFMPFGIKIDQLNNAHLLAFIDDKGNSRLNTLLENYDFVVYFDKDYYLAKLLEKGGIRVFNNAEAIRICDDKMLTHVSLVNHGIKMPKTISYPLRFGKESDHTFLTKVIEELGFPLIVKNNFGSLGEQVYLINNEGELKNISEKLKHTPHLYQEYIASSYGKDVRVVLVNKKIVGNMYRTATVKSEFKSNIEAGAIAQKIELKKEYQEMAIKVASIINLDYCGLDLLIGKGGEPIFCEVNAGAFFGPIEKFSHDNIAKPFVEYIVSEIYK